MDHLSHNNDPGNVAPIGASPNTKQDAWEFEEIILERGGLGLGFGIAARINKPPAPNDIYITKLIAGGAAIIDQRLRVNDIILSVNDVNMVNVSQGVAVAILKHAGNRVDLKVKRQITDITSCRDGGAIFIEVELFKGHSGLGFIFAGGTDQPLKPGDSGIYITKLVEGGAAASDGRISEGDRIVALKNLPEGLPDFFFENCTHEQATNALKKCKGKVTFIFQKEDQPHLSSPTPAASISHFEPQPMCNMVPICEMGPRSVSNEVFYVPRQVSIQRSVAGLGFNIVGGTDGEGIFVYSILSGGPADIAGQVRRGDKILAVNSVDLSQATREEAAVVLGQAGNIVNLELLYQPEEYEKCEAKLHSLENQVKSNSTLQITEKRSLFVRTLFDYDPSWDKDMPSRGLKFSFGDILYVNNASDDEWWQAKLLDNDGKEVSAGIIPSKTRWENRQRSKDQNVSFESNERSVSKKRMTFLRGGKDDDSSEGDSMILANSRSNSNHDVDKELGPIVSYQPVQRIEINYTRPIVILGPLKDRIINELISECPEKFGSYILHTTRHPRKYEVDGQDYHFVTYESMDADIKSRKFIEVGQYNGNYYGTSIAAVKEVAERGKHCIPDVKGKALKRLQNAGLYPITIFLKPSDPIFIMSMNDRMKEDQADEAYNEALQQEHDFIKYFTSIIKGHSFYDVYKQVQRAIKIHSKKTIWVASVDEK